MKKFLKLFIISSFVFLVGLYLPIYAHAEEDLSFTVFSIPTVDSHPATITTGPDGNLWFTEYLGRKIGRITPNGVITEFPVNMYPYNLTTGPDGNIWVTEGGRKIIRITPTGIVTEFFLPVDTRANDITTGSDGNLWFTYYHPEVDAITSKITVRKIGRMSSSGNLISEFPMPGDRMASYITSGSDGNLWFVTGGDLSNNEQKIARMTIDGIVTEYPLPASTGVTDFTRGPDGNFWYIDSGGRSVGRVTPSGAVTVFPVFGFGGNIDNGPDGNLWFDSGRDSIGNITPAGVPSEFSIPNNGTISDLTTGPDGNLWFTEYEGKIVRVNLKGTPPAPTITPTPTKTPTPTPMKRLRFTALGDSFISGEGDNQEGFDSGYDVKKNKLFTNCHISHSAWPYRVTKDLSLNLQLIMFPACSGATSKDMLKGSDDQPKQIDQVYNSDVVAVSAGGNDVGFDNLIKACILIDCKTVKKSIIKKIENLGNKNKLPKLYDEIRDAAGNNADIYVMGYPYILPHNKCSTTNMGIDAFVTLFKNYNSLGTRLAIRYLKDADISPTDVQKNMAARAFTFSKSEAETAKNVTDNLNTKIEQIVLARKDPHMHFVKVNYPNSPFEGKTLCSGDPYFNGFFIDFEHPTSLPGNIAMSFHPNHKGTAAYKKVFADYYLAHPHN